MSNLSELIPSGGAGKSGNFVASGAITAGQPVGLNPDGTISSGLVTGSAGAVATASTSACKTRVRVTYDSGNEAALILTENSANQLAFYYATFSGTTTTFSSETIAYTGNAGLFDIDYDSDTGYFAIVYNTSAGVYSKIGQISGGVVTFGSEYTIETASGTGSPRISYNQAAKCMVVWYYDTNGYPSVRWFSINSTGGVSKSGTKTIVQSVFGYTTDAIYNPDTKTTMLGVAQYATTIQYVLSAAPGVGQNVPTEIVWGERAGSGRDSEQEMAYNTNTKTLLGVSGAGSPASHSGTVCQPNTYGSNVTGYGSIGTRGYQNGVYFDEDANQFIFLDHDWYGTQDGSFYSYETYNGTLSSLIGTRNSFTANTPDYFGPVYIPSVKQGFAAFTDDNDSDKLKGVLISPACVRPVIGIAASSIADGAAGGVTLTGGIAEGLSGLTPGLVYYAQSDGSLGTDPYPPAKPVGRALSATTLNIGDV